MTSENAQNPGPGDLGSTSENTNPAPGAAADPTPGNGATPAAGTPRRRGARPTPLPEDFAEFLTDYAAVLETVPLSPDTRRTYVSRVRMFLAWLADGTGRRRYRGDPLTNPTARDWAVRDYRLYLLREATPKRSVRYCNNALAAQDDFYVRLGLGKANVGRDELPKTAPKAMDARAEIRWLRAVEAWPHARDRAIALLPFYAGLRIGDIVALDVDDVRLSARKGNLRVFGKGGKPRDVPVHPALAVLLQDWLDERASWPGAATERALFLSRRRGRLTTRAASDVFTAIAEAAGLEDATTAHVGRHTFVTRLIRGGEDLITVAEIAGHARLETLKVYSQPTDEDKHNALRHLTVDR
ncbi:tyrosine-type recombinase/integrase [Actinoallomurus sp. NPDC050550]|uniref:tyrosine-type recombinase/integrase n=1 Tax=Actinoallomurus sp. NPDC050550 TaxID=3154937 RepID=UPI0033ECFF95